jgi:hypothetical protein
MENLNVVSKFIKWYKGKSQQQKDFASALMMSKLSDEELINIKNLTDTTGKQLMDIFDQQPGEVRKK